MDEARWRWRFFWSRRSGARTIVALICALCALLLAIYLALPASDQQAIQLVWLSVVGSLGATGARVVVEALLVLFSVASVVLLLAPGYRQYRYLTLPTSLIPRISVYVDGDNELPEERIPALISFLRKFIGTERADLLFFMDATKASTKRYKTLYRYGFRPVDAPLNPTGAKEMYEAVDREIALHAFERALVGPPGQEFVIISSDGDFAPLVYRLTALGHKAHIWSFKVSLAYQAIAQYIPVTLVDLSQVLSEEAAELPTDRYDTSPERNQPRRQRPWAGRKKRRPPPRSSAHDSLPASVAPPTDLAERGAEPLYYAIAETLSAQRESEANFTRDQARDSRFRELLSTRLAPRLASVGYSSPSRVEYWLDHLKTLGVLISDSGRDFPAIGAMPAEAAASQLYAMARLMAGVSVGATSARPDGLVNIHSILERFDATSFTGAVAAPSLCALLAPENARRTTHARYFLRCARALGIVQFSDAPGSPDLISPPSLIPPTEPEPDDPHTAAPA